jgi:hypothetical protein
MKIMIVISFSFVNCIGLLSFHFNAQYRTQLFFLLFYNCILIHKDFKEWSFITKTAKTKWY